MSVLYASNDQSDTNCVYSDTDKHFFSIKQRKIMEKQENESKKKKKATSANTLLFAFMAGVITGLLIAPPRVIHLSKEEKSPKKIS
jgi:F0F1-type ATP synthase assembly protein I